MIDHESKLSYSHIVYQNVSRRVLQMEPMGGQIFETQNKAIARFDKAHRATHFIYIFGSGCGGSVCVCGRTGPDFIVTQFPPS